MAADRGRLAEVSGPAVVSSRRGQELDHDLNRADRTVHAVLIALQRPNASRYHFRDCSV